MFPAWLHLLSIGTLMLGTACALMIAIDVAGHPQKMGIMNVVWPVTALFGTVLTVWGYFRYGRLKTREAVEQRKNQEGHSKQAEMPFPAIVGKGALRCGSGCMIGDVIAEWLLFLVPAIATWFGWHSLFEEKIYTAWAVDYIFAFALGIVFQYFTIVPMRGLSPGKGIVAAIKADTLSLTAWQVGMYGFMAIAQFYLYGHLLGRHAEVNTPEFWFAMQIAMIAGFLTAYPVNWWLIRAGIKEKM